MIRLDQDQENELDRLLIDFRIINNNLFVIKLKNMIEDIMHKSFDQGYNQCGQDNWES